MHSETSSNLTLPRITEDQDWLSARVLLYDRIKLEVQCSRELEIVLILSWKSINMPCNLARPERFPELVSL